MRRHSRQCLFFFIVVLLIFIYRPRLTYKGPEESMPTTRNFGPQGYDVYNENSGWMPAPTDLLIERPPIIDLQAARDKEMADHESSSIVIFAILGSITLLSLFFLGANIHARHRLNAGKPPLWYHKFCVKKTKPNDMHLGSLWTRRNPSCPPMPPMPPVWRPYFHGHNTELPAQIHVRRVYRMRPYPSGYHRAPLVAFCGVPLADLAAPTLADSITPRQGQVQFAPPPPYQEAINAGPACPVPTTRPRPRSSSLPGMQPTRSRG